MGKLLLRLTKDQECFFKTTLIAKTAFIREAVDEKISGWKNEMNKLF